MAKLIVFAGLPASGKSTVAREVAGRTYHPWDRDHLTIDTSSRSVTDCVELLLAALQARC